jgi:[ribosomal protein S5]-alanine N-acetyltransferase
MFDLNSLPITTDRIVLKPVSMDDVYDVFKHFDRDITRFTYSDPNENIEQAIDFIYSARTALLNRTGLSLTMIDRQTQEFIGVCGLVRANTDLPEPGLWIKKKAHGKGYGKESMKAVVLWVWQNLTCDRLIYKADKLNVPSQKIATFIGGKLVGEEESINPKGKVLNLLVYHIDRVQ